MHHYVWPTLEVIFALITLISAQTYTACDPTNVTCPPTPGLNSNYYSIDFTTVSKTPTDWTVPSWCRVTYNTKGRKNGAELEFLQRYDSQQLFSKFYFLFGRVEFVVQAAPGPGIISDMMTLSDDLDELDWEFRGSLQDEVQTGWFGKGVTGLYNHSITPKIPTPMTQFHTYAFDWTPERVVWEDDGTVVRTLKASDCLGTNNQYPQTPMKAMMGLWDAGDPDHYDPWSAGMTPIPPPAGGYSFYVKSVKIWNSNPAACYNWTDHSGSWRSIKALSDPAACSSVTSTSSSSTVSPSGLSSAAMSSSAASAGSASISSASAIVQSATASSSKTAGLSSPTMSASTVTSMSSAIIKSSSLATSLSSTRSSLASTSVDLSSATPVSSSMVKTSSALAPVQLPTSSFLSTSLSSASASLTVPVGSSLSTISSTLPSSSHPPTPQPASTRTQSTQSSNVFPSSTQPPSVTSSASVHITSAPVLFTMPITVVLPGHITLSYTPIVQNLTKLVSSLESLLHGQNLKRAVKFACPETSETMLHTSIAPLGAASASTTSFPAKPIDLASDDSLPAMSSVFLGPVSPDESTPSTELLDSARHPPQTGALYHPLHGYQHEYLHEQVRRVVGGSGAAESAAAMASDQSTEDGADTDGDVSASDDDAVDQYAQSAVAAASSTNVQSSYDAVATDDDDGPTSTTTSRYIPAGQSAGSQALPAYPNSSFSNTTAVAATAPSVHHQHISTAERVSPYWKVGLYSWTMLWTFVFFLE